MGDILVLGIVRKKLEGPGNVLSIMAKLFLT